MLELLYDQDKINKMAGLIQEALEKRDEILNSLDFFEYIYKFPILENKLYKLKDDFNYFKKNIDSELIYELRISSFLKALEMPFLYVLDSRIFYNHFHFELEKLKKPDENFNSKSIVFIYNLFVETYKSFKEIFTVEPKMNSVNLKYLDVLFENCDPIHELRIFSLNYSDQVSNMIELFKIHRMMKVFNSFCPYLNNFIEFLNLKKHSEIDSLSQLHKEIESNKEYSVKDLRLVLDTSSHYVFKLLENYPDVLMMFKIYSENLNLTKFIYQIHEDFGAHSDVQIELMNEEIQKEGYKIKNVQLIYLKQLIRFIKQMKDLTNDSDTIIFKKFYEHYLQHSGCKTAICQFKELEHNEVYIENYQKVFSNVLFQIDYDEFRYFYLCL